MSLLDTIQSFLKDPPPEFAFEISAAGIAMSRTRPPVLAQRLPLPQGAVVPSPVKENVVDPAALEEVVRRLLPGPGGHRNVALILPDNAMRLSVLEFDNLPEKEEERAALVRFRLKKTVPFDVESATVAWFAQPGNKVVVALAPAGTIAQYEAPFRAAKLRPGVVIPAALAMLELLPPTGSFLVAHLHSGALTVLVVGNGILTLVRSLELTAHADGAADFLDEIVSGLYATRIYVEDQAGARPDSLYLAGFGADTARATERLNFELDIPVEIVQETDPGLAGYLYSLYPRANTRTPAAA
jgi:type IV pilus assembly protein PilM